MPYPYQVLRDHIGDLLHRLQESDEKKIYNLSLPHLALLLSMFEMPFVAVEDSPEKALRLFADLSFFRRVFPGPPEEPVLYVPPPTRPDHVGLRAKALHTLQRYPSAGIVTSADACAMEFTISTIEDSVVAVKKGLTLERNALNERLSILGYKEVSVVVEKGEYSRRGWLFDVYPVTEDAPVRLEFFGDEIELIRTFDIDTQRSKEEIKELTIFPAQEGMPTMDILEEVQKLKRRTIFWAAGGGGHEQDSTRAGVPSPFIAVSHLPIVGPGIDSQEMTLKGLGITPDERRTLEDIVAGLIKAGVTSGPSGAVSLPPAATMALMILPSPSQAERLKDILFDGGIIAPIMEIHRIPSYRGPICITTGTLSSGLRVPGVLLLTDRELFGERPLYRPIKKSRVSRLLLTIDDLKPGDFVVHKDHGIGRFTGLRKQTTEGYEEDLITIEYAEGDRLHMPSQSIQKLQKYAAGEGRTPSLDRLGGKSWQRTKQRVRKGIREMAEKLLRLYAERKVSRSFLFTEDTALHREFDDFFPYEETPDQTRAIEEIKRHLHSEKPMDMLLCGDVGYGKTEVAMKAAFRAVYDGKQVAVLVPTTLLAEQHYRTFKTRFSGFPVTIDYLSRFKSREAVQESVRALSRGEIDIVIGTHMLLGKNVTFSELGLLIIDEEHRFGVAQKERLKELRKGVDVLTLTATPIPRTLNMSLSGIREMCVIETPPEERLAVRSFVTVFSGKVIQEALTRELKREGQIFFVHNRIHDIEKISASVRHLVPDASIATAHGQMKETDLEKIMLDFFNRKIDVLVCTSIIGSGLDIPTANTLIVDRADTFGLSDLYQLRGRVGRGTTQAFAYFLIPGEDIITDEAKKRLRALQEMSYLGAGFRLALRDLEIRGAGNILGAEQSGHIYKVGFEMYMEMLEKAVAEIKGEVVTEEVEPQIRLQRSAFIPEEYIRDITLRLSMYKRLSSAKSTEALSEIRDEMFDRFGRLPEEVNNLLYAMKIKILCRHLYIQKIAESDGKYRFTFLQDVENTYRVPEDFFDRMLKALFTLSSHKGPDSDKGIRFFPDGFELDTREKSSNDDAVLKTLQVLLGSLSHDTH